MQNTNTTTTRTHTTSTTATMSADALLEVLLVQTGHGERQERPSEADEFLRRRAAGDRVRARFAGLDGVGA